MFGLLLLIVTSFGLMGYGYRTMKTGRLPVNPARALKLAMAWAFFSIGMSSMAAFAEAAAAPVAVSTGLGLGYIGVALSTGLACIGAGVGVGFIGSAALGVISEKPSMFGTTLIYVGLAEGVAIYGLVISLFILGRL